MRAVQTWLDEYSESHLNKTNKTIHWVCVPLIVWSVFGLLWSIPVPRAMSDVSPLFNWALIAGVVMLFYYFLLSPKLALGMFPVWAGLLWVTHWVSNFAIPLWQISLIIFVGAWIGQFIGHLIEKKKPSLFKDLQFLLIGPLWLLSHVYRKLGLSF